MSLLEGARLAVRTLYPVMTAKCMEEVRMDVLQAMLGLVTRQDLDKSALSFIVCVYIRYVFIWLVRCFPL